MKETIKQAGIRLKKFEPKLREEILECYKRYKKNFKNSKDSTGQGYKFTSKGLKPYIWKHTKEENKKACFSILLWVFHAGRYSSLNSLRKNKRIMREVFKEDKEILKILNFSYKVILRDGNLEELKKRGVFE